MSLPLLFPFLVFLHNPRRLLEPQFWGEDGIVWYQQAHEVGFASLLLPAGGYLNSFQRLVALAVQPLPLAWAPFLFALVAVLVQAAPAMFLVSRRMDRAWPHRNSGMAFAILYLLMPNAPETAAGLTNSQWYLAILAFLILVSTPAKSLWGRGLETLTLLAAGFSGPFCILLMPTALWQVLVSGADGRRDALWRAAVLGVACLVQIGYILNASEAGRSQAPLGAAPGLLIQIFGMISLGAGLGLRTLSELTAADSRIIYILRYSAAVMCAVLGIIALLRGPRMLVQFSIFAGAVFVLSLMRPLISLTDPQLPLMLMPGTGNRYFFYPMLAWWGALFVLAASRRRTLKFAGSGLLALTIIWAIPADWGDIYAVPPTDFAARARIFDAAPPGMRMEFDTHVPGWPRMVLTK